MTLSRKGQTTGKSIQVVLAGFDGLSVMVQQLRGQVVGIHGSNTSFLQQSIAGDFVNEINVEGLGVLG